MQKIISYPISFIALFLFLMTLVIFHPIQWICFNLVGYQAHKKSVDYLNFVLVRIGHVLGTTYKVENREDIPKGVPIIFVANHQSLFDIIAIIWFFRKFHPKFVSKKELGKGVPSVSYNLRHGGSVLIDRKDPKQAVPNIKKLSEFNILVNNLDAISLDLYNEYIIEYDNNLLTEVDKNEQKNIKINKKIHELFLPYMLYLQILLSNNPE